MNRVLEYGLMGAAQGALQGMLGEWQQNQKDEQAINLLAAKAMEDQRSKQLAYQNSALLNLQKFNEATQLADQNNTAKASLQTQQNTFDAQQDDINNTSRAQIASGNNAASIQVAKSRAAASAAALSAPPKGKLVAVQDPSGNISFQTAQPGDSLTSGSKLTSLSGEPDFSQLPIGMLGNLGAPTSVPATAPQAPQAATSGSAQAGSSSLTPVDAASLDHAPPLGTWVKLQDGSVKQYSGTGG